MAWKCTEGLHCSPLLPWLTAAALSLNIGPISKIVVPIIDLDTNFLPFVQDTEIFQDTTDWKMQSSMLLSARLTG